MSAETELAREIRRFLDGEDRSMAQARKIEGLVLENFELETWFDDAIGALAQYDPTGGPHYYDERALAGVLREVLDDIGDHTR